MRKEKSEYERLMKDREWRIGLAMLDEMIKNAEKAVDFFPDNIKDIIDSRFGRTPFFLYGYYLPEEKAEEILAKHKKWKRRKTRDILAWFYFMYSPTSSREMFEMARALAKKYNNLDDLIRDWKDAEFNSFIEACERAYYGIKEVGT